MKELSAAKIARNMKIGLAALGVSVGLVSTILKKGIGYGQESIQRHMKYGAIGPEGPRFIQERIDTMINQIRHAQTPQGSRMTANEAERQRRWEELSRKWEPYADMMASALLRIAEFFAPGSSTEDAARRSVPKEQFTRTRHGIGRYGVG